jgi:hypothetical protein
LAKSSAEKTGTKTQSIIIQDKEKLKLAFFINIACVLYSIKKVSKVKTLEALLIIDIECPNGRIEESTIICQSKNVYYFKNKINFPFMKL